MKITDYERIQELVDGNLFLIDGPNGTKTISALDLAAALSGMMGGGSGGGISSGIDFSDLTPVNTLSAGDKFLVGGTEGNKAIGAEDALFAILDSFIPVEQRRHIFRGKNLGIVITEEQKLRIRDGTFKGFFLGDYWDISGHIWRIVDFNYWMNCGDTTFNTPHLVVMPDKILYNHRMNETNVTTGGYVNSEMYTSGLTQAKTMITGAFGDALLTHREYLVNAVSNGMASGRSWYNSSVELPNEVMIYGSYMHAPGNDGTNKGHRYTIDNTQLALMAMCSRFIHTRESYWLRDVVSASNFALVNNNGLANNLNATNSNGVRPVFPVG